METIYLDYNATAPLNPNIRDQLFELWTQDNILNPSSIHWAGRNARKHFESARRRIAQFFDRKPSEVIFTSGGSEADNMALLGVPAKRIITSKVEHPAVLETVEYLEKNGRDVVYLPVDANGKLDLEMLKNCVTPESLVSIMAVNNETGVIFPIDEVTAICHEVGALVHVDAVQSIGRLPICSAPDLITISGHKLGAPVGAGALIARELIHMAPIIHGGAQERGRRAGTGNVIGALGLAMALEHAEKNREVETERLQKLRDKLEVEIKQISGVEIVAESAPRVCNTTTLVFEDIEDESIVHALDLAGIACSSGSACASGSLEASHVLISMGIPAKKAKSALRISMGGSTTNHHIEKLVASLREIVPSVRDS